LCLVHGLTPDRPSLVWKRQQAAESACCWRILRGGLVVYEMVARFFRYAVTHRQPEDGLVNHP